MKIGIIGLGFMGGVHLSAIEHIDIEGLTLAAASSRTRPVEGTMTRGNLHHVESSALPAGIPWYSDWHQLLDQDIEWLSKEECRGGAILDLLIHDIDQALSLFGQPSTVRAVSDGEIDTVQGTLQYANGLKVQIEGGWYTPEVPFSSSFHIQGEDAALVFEERKLRMNLSGEEQSIAIPERSEYLEQMTYFVECCRNNKAPELCLPSESAEAVRLATLLKASRDQNGRELSCSV